MHQLASRLIFACGMLGVACATAIDAPLSGDEDGSGGSESNGGSLSSSGTGGSSAGTTSKSGSSSAGKANGGGPGAFGGAATSGGGGAGGSGSGGKAGESSAGNGGVSSGGAGGSGNGGKAGSGSSGSTNGGSTAGTGSGGTPPSTTCDGVADWTNSKTYVIGDSVASTCSGPFAHGCPDGQSHKFECDPMAGVAALPWCKDRAPGSGNGWWEAWVDMGQCD